MKSRVLYRKREISFHAGAEYACKWINHFVEGGSRGALRGYGKMVAEDRIIKEKEGFQRKMRIKRQERKMQRD